MRVRKASNGLTTTTPPFWLTLPPNPSHPSPHLVLSTLRLVGSGLVAWRNAGWLKALSNSAWNLNRQRSVKGISLEIAMSSKNPCGPLRQTGAAIVPGVVLGEMKAVFAPPFALARYFGLIKVTKLTPGTW